MFPTKMFKILPTKDISSELIGYLTRLSSSFHLTGLLILSTKRSDRSLGTGNSNSVLFWRGGGVSIQFHLLVQEIFVYTKYVAH